MTLKCTFCLDHREVAARHGMLAFSKPGKGSADTPSATLYFVKGSVAAGGSPLVPCPRCRASKAAAAAQVPDLLDSQPDLTRGQLMWLRGIGKDRALASRRNSAISVLEQRGYIEIEPSGELWQVTASGRARLAALSAGVPPTWKWHS